MINNTIENNYLSTETVIFYSHTGEIWNRKLTKLENVFVFQVAIEIDMLDTNNPRSVLEAS